VFGDDRCGHLVEYLGLNLGIRAHAHCAGWIGFGCCPYCDA